MLLSWTSHCAATATRRRRIVRAISVRSVCLHWTSWRDVCRSHIVHSHDSSAVCPVYHWMNTIHRWCYPTDESTDSRYCTQHVCLSVSLSVCHSVLTLCTVTTHLQCVRSTTEWTQSAHDVTQTDESTDSRYCSQHVCLSVCLSVTPFCSVWHAAEWTQSAHDVTQRTSLRTHGIAVSMSVWLSDCLSVSLHSALCRDYHWMNTIRQWCYPTDESTDSRYCCQHVYLSVSLSVGLSVCHSILLCVFHAAKSTSLQHLLYSLSENV